jgi:hypothetical protein
MQLRGLLAGALLSSGLVYAQNLTLPELVMMTPLRLLCQINVLWHDQCLICPS